MSRLQFRIDGGPGQITLEAYLQVLNRARLILADIDSAITAQPRGSFDWVLTDLGMKKAAVAEVEPRPKLPQADERTGLLVGRSFVSGLDAIESGTDELPLCLLGVEGAK